MRCRNYHFSRYGKWSGSEALYAINANMNPIRYKAAFSSFEFLWSSRPRSHGRGRDRPIGGMDRD